jgi:hypothetical protein
VETRLIEPNYSEAVFIEKRGGMGPYAGADCNLTLSYSRRRKLAFCSKDEECRRMFLELIKMEQPIGKGRVRGRGREVMVADFYVLE